MTYIGVYLTHDLTWSEHVKQLYKLRIRPHLEYASVVWSPHLEKDKKMLEDVQKFRLHMSTKHWDFEYSILLHELNLESLERRRGIARLCLLYI